MTRSLEDPGSVVTFTRLEEIEVLQAALGTIDQRPIVRVALGQIEFAADHIVTGAGVAAYADAFDVGSRTLVDGECDRNGMRLEIAIAARTHDREGVAAPRGLDLHFLDGFLQRFGVIERADVDAREAAQ